MITTDVDEGAVERDYREFERAFTVMAAQELNQSGYNIAHRAMVLTPHRDPQKIRQQLAAPATHARGLRPGEKPPTVAEAIINARRGRRGQKGFTGEPMRRAETRLVRMKMLGAYYIAAGWLEAMKVLQRYGVKPMDIPNHIVDFGIPDGDAIPAKPNREEMSVSVINKSNGAETIGRPAAEKALAEETEVFEERLEDRIHRLWNQR